MTPLILAAVAVAVVDAAWLHWLWLIPQERVPRRPTAHLAAHLCGIALAIGGIALGGRAIVWVAGAVAISLGSFFVWLLGQAALPDAEIALKVGDVLPRLSARTDTGDAWSTEDLRGRRTLFKLFRGSW